MILWGLDATIISRCKKLNPIARALHNRTAGKTETADKTEAAGDSEKKGFPSIHKQIRYKSENIISHIPFIWYFT